MGFMRQTTFRCFRFILPIFLIIPILLPFTCHAQEREELLFLDLDGIIVTATKQIQKVKEAPATASVITALEIRNMGARDIMDVLKTIPGYGVTRGYFGREDIEVRGIKT
ncbi:MAG: TonB-dependent receptor plug domain-containing protein, partial [Proteobacteria bacterium]|nr:TonB-dependent receptor plug domain-containing protein [Pseudomonadota bacterium]